MDIHEDVWSAPSIRASPRTRHTPLSATEDYAPHVRPLRAETPKYWSGTEIIPSGQPDIVLLSVIAVNPGARKRRAICRQITRIVHECEQLGRNQAVALDGHM